MYYEKVYIVSPRELRWKMDEIAEKLSVDEDFQNMKVNYAKREIEIKNKPLAEENTIGFRTVVKIYFLFAQEYPKWSKGRTYVYGNGYYHSGYEITKEQYMIEMGITSDLSKQGILNKGENQ